MIPGRATDWGWEELSAGGASRHDIAWMRPLVAAAPWITLAILLLMMSLLGGTLAIREGVLFDLPDSDLNEGESTSLVALLLPMSHETLVFFDDARFMLGDAQSMDAFAEQLAERSAKLKERSLLVLADRRISVGETMKFAAIAKSSGMERILFAERTARPEGEE